MSLFPMEDDFIPSINQSEFMEFFEEKFQKFDDADEDYSPRSYSGRGMYGRTCPAVTIPGWLLDTTLADLKKNDISACSDNMGRDFIVYAKN